MTSVKEEIVLLKEQLAEAKVIAKLAIRMAEKEQCAHESTHRGGLIWTICDDCGFSWADDEGYKGNQTIAKLDALRERLELLPDIRSTISKYKRERNAALAAAQECNANINEIIADLKGKE